MKLGTISYNNKIYNLDYMDSETINSLLKNVMADRKEKMSNIKKELADKK